VKLINEVIFAVTDSSFKHLDNTIRLQLFVGEQ